MGATWNDVFTMLEVLEWHDGPILYAAVDRADVVHLGMAVPDDQDLLIPISDERLDALRAGAISVRDAYREPEQPQALLYSRLTSAITALDAIPEQYLPTGDHFLTPIEGES